MSENQYAGFKKISDLYSWVNQLDSSNLQKAQLIWPLDSEYPYVVQTTKALVKNAERYLGTKLPLKRKPSGLKNVYLDQIWRHSRPIKDLGRRTPTYWLFLLEDEKESLVRELAADLLMGGELIECHLEPMPEAPLQSPPKNYSNPTNYHAHHTEKSKSKRLTAIKSQGEDASRLARIGLDGVISLGVYTEGSVTLALPVGWSPPLLPEICWPSAQTNIFLYQDVQDDQHSLWSLTYESEPKPLIHLVRCITPLPMFADGLQNARSQGEKGYRVRVTERPPSMSRSLLIGSRETQNFIFRFRSVGNEFSHALTQALNQLEGYMLPPMRYAALDWDESETSDGPERWHFLYAEHVTGELLSAWSLIERFELNIPLHEMEISNVYTLSNSKVSPPLELLANPNFDQSIINLKEMLCQPNDDQLTLIEASEENEYKPLITQIKLSEMKPFSELILELTEGWNGAELQKATTRNLKPEALEQWKHESERSLKNLVTLEHEALARATREAFKLLRKESDLAIQSLTEASAPVADATELSTVLREHIIQVDQDFNRLYDALTASVQEITQPRRQWVSEQTELSAKRLADYAPTLQDLHSVRSRTNQITTELTSQTERLTNATEEIVALRERWQQQAEHSERVADEARQQLQLLERVAREAMSRVNDARKVTKDQRSQAEQRRAEVNAREKKLAKERNAVKKLEDENERKHLQNENDERELTLRRENAEREKDRIIYRRDHEIPELNKKVLDLEAQVVALEPKKVDREHNEITAKLNQLKASVNHIEQQQKEIKEKITEYQELITNHKKEKEQLETDIEQAKSLIAKVNQEKKEHEQLKQHYRSLKPDSTQQNLDELKQKKELLEEKINSLPELNQELVTIREQITTLETDREEVDVVIDKLEKENLNLRNLQRRGLVSDKELKIKMALVKQLQGLINREPKFRDRLALWIVGK